MKDHIYKLREATLTELNKAYASVSYPFADPHCQYLKGMYVALTEVIETMEREETSNEEI